MIVNSIEKLKALSAVLVPVVIAWVGWNYTRAISEREVEAKFVELGVSILQAPPDEASVNLRKWATEVLNRYSGVKLDEKTIEELQNVPLPSSSNWSDAPPKLGWCYQEDSLVPGPERYSVHCHWAEDRCNKAKGNRSDIGQSLCKLVELGEADWMPNKKGWQGSWFEFRPVPFPDPFPKLPLVTGMTGTNDQ